ncbi:MAG: SusC/RagA family TonB-linked outer membrane protein [Marinoscillum sp.]|uniref:SusC/RagA family TonB-linked outer membrane protein n=3 Tax=Marinoscillum sp. TaxID=2024838 RepID=UPI0032F6C85D
MKRILLLSFMLTFVFAFSALAQRTVSGTVTSAEDGSGIPGVNVVLKGTTTGTTSDLDGNYRLSVPEEGGTLVFSFVGLEPKEVEIGARSVIDVGMSSDVQQLTEVVVTALGIERQEKSLTYAVQDVKGDGLTQARETNIVNSLSGQVAGVQVTSSSGTPGASSRVVLRGASTISGSNQPLFVVDGVPIDNSNFGTAGNGGGYDLPNGAASLNPDDVESISVLKGPVAAALYGNRGANGVILVTTKTGKGKKGLGVSVNSSTMFQTPLRLQDFQNSYGQGASNTYFEFVNGQSGYGDGVDESWGAPLDVGLEFVQWSDYKDDGTTSSPSPWKSYPNNIKDFYETGVQLSNNVAIAGSDGDNAFRLSATNMNQTGMVPNTDFNRWNINSSASLRLLEGLEASFSANYIKEHADNLASIGYTNDNPVQQMIWSGRNVDLPALKDYKNLPLSPEGTAAAGTPLNWNTVFQNNPYWGQDVNLQGYDKDRLIGNVKLAYQFNDWLSAYVRTGIDNWDMRNSNIKAIGTNSASDGFYSDQVRRFTEINHFYMVTANKTFGDFGVAVSVGGNNMIQEYTRHYVGVPALELPGLYNVSNLKSGSTPTLINTFEAEKINSLLGTAQLSFRDFVFLDISGRNDWWSVLPKADNSYFYPSASLSFVLTDMLDIYSNALPYLKVRAGWSKVGSSGGLDPYELQQLYSFRTTPYGSVSLAYNPATLNNPNIKPETTTGIEIGLAAKFFDGRISLDATYYDQTSEDLIVEVEVSPTSGYQAAFDNIGLIENKGIELQLGATIVDTKDFSAGLNLNFATYNNDVITVNNIDGDEGAIVLGGQWNVDLQAREGHPYGVLFGPGYLKDEDGNIVHVNGRPQIDPTYRVLGDIQPDWTGGIAVNLRYKGLSLSSLFDAKWGGDIYTMTTTWGRYAGVLAETLKGREEGIVGKGVMQSGTDTDGNPIYVPNNIVVTAETYNKAAFSNGVAEGSVFDASYIKLRQVTLNWKLPSQWFTNVPFKDVNVALVGRNLALLYSKVPHIDPESGFSNSDAQQGQEFGQLPSARSMGFNINFKL